MLETAQMIELKRRSMHRRGHGLARRASPQVLPQDRMRRHRKHSLKGRLGGHTLVRHEVHSCGLTAMASSRTARMAEEQARQGRRLRAPWAPRHLAGERAARSPGGGRVGDGGWHPPRRAVNAGLRARRSRRRPSAESPSRATSSPGWRARSAMPGGWAGGGWRRNAAKSLRAVAGAEARMSCAYSRGFQIRA